MKNKKPPRYSTRYHFIRDRGILICMQHAQRTCNYQNKYLFAFRFRFHFSFNFSFHLVSAMMSDTNIRAPRAAHMHLHARKHVVLDGFLFVCLFAFQSLYSKLKHNAILMNRNSVGANTCYARLVPNQFTNLHNYKRALIDSIENKHIIYNVRVLVWCTHITDTHSSIVFDWNPK